MVNGNESVGHNEACVYVDGNDSGEREKLIKRKGMDTMRRWRGWV